MCFWDLLQPILWGWDAWQRGRGTCINEHSTHTFLIIEYNNLWLIYVCPLHLDIETGHPKVNISNKTGLHNSSKMQIYCCNVQRCVNYGSCMSFVGLVTVDSLMDPVSCHPHMCKHFSLLRSESQISDRLEPWEVVTHRVSPRSSSRTSWSSTTGWRRSQTGTATSSRGNRDYLHCTSWTSSFVML